MLAYQHNEIAILRSTLESIRALIFRKFSFFCSLQMIVFIVSIIMVGGSYRFRVLDDQAHPLSNIYTSVLFLAVNSISVLITFVGHTDLKIEGERLKAAHSALMNYSRDYTNSDFVDYEWKILGELDIKAQRFYFRRIYNYLLVMFCILISFVSSPLLL